MTMRERIAAGKLYVDFVEGLPADLTEGMRNMEAFNSTNSEDIPKRERILAKIFGVNSKIWVDAPFYFRYGKNIHVGPNCNISFCCVIMDDTDIYIGEDTSIGPNTTILTACKPVAPEYRKFLYAEPVHIGKNCIIGAGCIINPGVTIGDNCCIEAGSVVTEDIPANTVAAGNPCKVIHEIGEEDKRSYGKGKPIDPKDIEEISNLAKGDRNRPINTLHWKFGDMPDGSENKIKWN